MTICETILLQSISTKKSKPGDSLSLKTYLSMNAKDPPVMLLEGTVVEAKSKGAGQRQSFLRVRVDRAVRKDGGEMPIEARIVALASRDSFQEGWNYPVIIADRYPRSPEDDERQPGEIKTSDREPHTSPLDSLSDSPTRFRVVCNDKKKLTPQQQPCSEVLKARGVYGYKKLELEPPKGDSPAESALTSQGDNVTLKAGTILVLEIEKLPTTKSDAP